ncbi:MAG: DUF2933 domain-containing protein [Deltaproteobacteria bacterium]|nr:DUF2933 domain-containing protein [Deltaproteobacteria bacterium]
MNHSSHTTKSRPVFWKNPLTIIGIIAFGYWVFTYHPQHALGYLPYLILLLCPLMHIFMHGGHGGHSGYSNHSDLKGNNESDPSFKEK